MEQLWTLARFSRVHWLETKKGARPSVTKLGHEFINLSASWWFSLVQSHTHWHFLCPPWSRQGTCRPPPTPARTHILVQDSCATYCKLPTPSSQTAHNPRCEFRRGRAIAAQESCLSLAVNLKGRTFLQDQHVCSEAGILAH